MFHKAKINNTAIVLREIHVSTSLLKDLSNPVLPSCELYSFLVVYICTFLCVVVEGSRSEGLLWCILFHQFCLNWTFIGYYAESSALGEILPVVRDFCSLYLVRFVPPPSLLLTHEDWGASRVGKNFWRRNSLWTRKWWKTRHFLLCCSAHFCLGNIAPCWICCDCRTLVF